MTIPKIYKNKNFMLLFGGQMVSSIGSAIFRIGIIWYIMSIVNDNQIGLYISLFGAIAMVPHIFIGPIAGVIIDKIDRKKIIYWTDFIRGITMFILLIILQLGFMNIPILFLISFINGSIHSMFVSAIQASIPTIVEKDDLVTANSMNAMTKNLSVIMGGVISGFLYYYFGIGTILLINGLSFILSGISEMFINMPHQKKANTIKNTNILKDLREVVTYINESQLLKFVIIVAIVINFSSAPIWETLIPKTIKTIMELSSKEFGFIQSVFTLGSLVILFFIPSIVKRIKMKTSLGVSVLLEGLAAVFYGLVLFIGSFYGLKVQTIYFIFLGITFVYGIVISLMNIPLMTAFQKMVSNEHRGRFFSILNAFFMASIPLGMLFFGALSDKINIIYVYSISGLIVVICGVLIFRNKDLETIN